MFSSRNFITLILSILFLVSTLSSAEEKTDDWIKVATENLKKTEQQLSVNGVVPGDENQLKELTFIKGKAKTCVENSTEGLSKSSTNLEALGQSAEGESKDVTEKRRTLQATQKELDKRLNTCNLLLIQAEDYIAEINRRKTEQLARELFNHGPHIARVLQDNLLQPTQWWQPGLAYIFRQLNLVTLSNTSKVILLILLVVAVILGAYLKSGAIKRLIPLSSSQTDNYSGFTLALRSCLAKSLPVLLPLLLFSAMIQVLAEGAVSAFIYSAALSSVIYLLLIILIKSVFAPCAPAKPFLADAPVQGKKLSRRLIVALTITWLGYLFFATALNTQFNESAYYLIRSTLLSLLVINLIAITWLARHFSWSLLPNGIRLLVTLGLVVLLLADFAGFRNFSRYLLTGLVGSMFGLAITVMINRFFADLYDQMDSGRQNWQRNLRNALGLKAEEKFPGMPWLRLLTFLSFWGLLITLLLRVWGQSQRGEAFLLEHLTQGFSIGSLEIIPSRILLALLLFAVVISISRLIKQNLSKRWIQHTNLDRGAQEAMITISGYLGFILALMIALSIAGVEFKNLAIVAGALSVGIGFGLQNIVNNFVSGLILLFERPIRRGDWIVVGNTEGNVKSINIRSTEIQTFDRANVIVPNSELISSQVTNWVLHDAMGRIIIPVSVAYGSNTEQVKDILQKIADDNHEVIRDSGYIPSPIILFRNFGDSALEFELRCYIRNIEKRLSVISDMNFAVDKAFREAGIEIPFPQRDVHMIEPQSPLPVDRPDNSDG